FIGLCIKAVALLVSLFVTLFINSNGAEDIYMGLDLLDVYNFNIEYYIGVASFLIALTIMKAYLAYLVIKLFMKFDLNYPFNEKTASIITKISHYALSIGVVTIIAENYGNRIMRQGITLQIDWGAEQFLFFAGIIYIIALIFKKGVEIQNENELTI
ncbi:MAG: DUF2975 domain-containing protein, partial [Aequorivita sp.]|nr:DUF2975 domain-containing protein [Aequorivita sp.]